MSANEKKYDIEKIRAGHKVLKEFTYELKPVVRGYNDRTLYVNLATLEIKEKPVPAEMKKKFIGGKGFDLKLLWDAVSGRHALGQPRERDQHRHRPHRRQHQLPGIGQVHRHHHLAADRHPHRLQRRRPLRPLSEILRLRRPGDPGQGGPRGHHLHRRQPGQDPDHGGAARGRGLARPGRAAARHVRGQRTRKAARVGGIGRARRRARLDRLPEFLLLGQAPQGAAPEAGGTRRHRHRVPRQEAQGPGGQVFRPDRQIQQPGRHGDPAEDRAEAAQGDHDPGRQAVPDAHHRHRPPGRDHERLRSAAGEEFPLRQPSRGGQAGLLGLEEAFHAERPRRLLVRLHHVLRPRRGQLRAEDRPLQGPQGPGRRPRVRDRRRLRLQPGHLRPRRRDRDQLLLRHLRHRHHLLRHPDRLRHGLLRERHPEQGAHRRPGNDLGQLARRRWSCCTRSPAAKASA